MTGARLVFVLLLALAWAAPAAATPPRQGDTPKINVDIDALPEINYETGTFKTAVRVTGDTDILRENKEFARYQLILLDGATQVFQSPPKPFDIDNTDIVIPLSEMPSTVIPSEPRRYQVAVKIFLPELEVESPPLGFTFPSQAKPNPLLTYGLPALGVVLVLVGGFFGWRWWSKRPKRDVPKPASIYNPPTERLPPLPGGMPGGAPAGMPPSSRPPSNPGRQSQPQGPAPAAAPRASSLPKQNHDADATMIFSIAGPGAGASAGAGPRLRIKVLETPDPSQRREETISSFPCVIGRGDVAFPLAGDSSMSRKHAEISVQGSSFTITDLNSGNGIFIDGQRQAAGQPVRIDGRTTVRVGLFTTLELEPK